MLFKCQFYFFYSSKESRKKEPQFSQKSSVTFKKRKAQIRIFHWFLKDRVTPNGCLKCSFVITLINYILKYIQIEKRSI